MVKLFPSLSSRPTIAIIVPALDEEKGIGKVLGSLPKRERFRILVVDNGSSDNTAQLASGLGAEVLREHRRGYGGACLRGLQAIRDEEIVVFLDSDFSEYPEDIDLLLDPIVSGEADLVIGSRTLLPANRRALPVHQRLGNRLACSLIQFLFGFRYTDLGPFRAIRTGSLVHLQMQDLDYGWTVEMQVKALLAGLRVQEVPVRYRPRIGTSKISGTLLGSIRAGCKIVYVVFALAKQRGNRDLFNA